jgi:two-component system, NarL family, nitrate/nitrite response regulator NarL
LIVDDHRLFAEAIELTVRRMGLDVLPVVTTADEALAAARAQHPDLVLVDIGLPDRSGISLGEQILQELPGTKVVALTAIEDASLVREALRVGFAGYITKDTEADKFVRSLRSVLEGQVVVPASASRAVVGNGNGSSDHDLIYSQLTPRELEVLRLLVEGNSSREIAQALGVSPNTVRTHVQGILAKLQVHSRLEAAAFAVRHDLVRIRR